MTQNLVSNLQYDGIKLFPTEKEQMMSLTAGKTAEEVRRAMAASGAGEFDAIEHDLTKWEQLDKSYRILHNSIVLAVATVAKSDQRMFRFCKDEKLRNEVSLYLKQILSDRNILAGELEAIYNLHKDKSGEIAPDEFLTAIDVQNMYHTLYIRVFSALMPQIDQYMALYASETQRVQNYIESNPEEVARARELLTTVGIIPTPQTSPL